MPDQPGDDGAVRVLDGAHGTTLLLDRPARRNALTLPMWRRLGELVTEHSERLDAPPVQLRGAGGYFCSGADLATLAWARADRRHAEEFVTTVVNALLRLHTAPRPVLALVEGGAAGGGVEIMAACQSRTALGDPTLVFPFGRHGVRLDGFTHWRLTQLIGDRATARLTEGHHVLAAQEARALGLFDQVPSSADHPAAAPTETTRSASYLHPGETFEDAVQRAAAPMLAGLVGHSR